MSREIDVVLGEIEGTCITCPVCAMTSFHPKDVEYGYCGNCHEFTTPRPPSPELLLVMARRSGSATYGTH